MPHREAVSAPSRLSTCQKLFQCLTILAKQECCDIEQTYAGPALGIETCAGISFQILQACQRQQGRHAGHDCPNVVECSYWQEGKIQWTYIDSNAFLSNYLGYMHTSYNLQPMLTHYVKYHQWPDCYMLRNDFSVKWRSGTNTRDWVFSFWYMTLTAEYYQQCCYLIYLLLPMQSGFQTNWESASVFPLRSTHILANDSSVPCPRRTQAGSPGQIKADSQCWCLVLLFLFPSFSEAALSSETPLNFFSPTFYFFSPNPPNFSPIPLQISSKP